MVKLCFGVIQNNIALKLGLVEYQSRLRFGVIQNNIALKPGVGTSTAV